MSHAHTHITHTNTPLPAIKAFPGFSITIVLYEHTHTPAPSQIVKGQRGGSGHDGGSTFKRKAETASCFIHVTSPSNSQQIISLQRSIFFFFPAFDNWAPTHTHTCTSTHTPLPDEWPTPCCFLCLAVCEGFSFLDDNVFSRKKNETQRDAAET